MTRWLTAALSFTLLSVSVSQQANSAKPQSAADLLPEGCIAYAEMPQPSRLLDTLFDHPIYERVKQLDEYQAAISNQKYVFFQAIVSHVESQIGMGWREAFDTLLDGGLAVAFDPKTDGAAAIAKASDTKALEQVVNALVKMARADAAEKGKKDAIPEMDYRGFTVYGQPKGRVAVAGPWLIMVNNDDLGKAILDEYLDGAGSTLSTNGKFKQARSTIDDDATAWLWVDVDTIRKSGNAPALAHGESDNPGVELLVGGILSSLTKASFATASLHVEEGSTRLSFQLPHEPDGVEETREFYFGPNGTGSAAELLNPPSTVFSLSTYRNFSEMWLRAGDLFDENINDELAKADSNLANLFGGKDFGEDILGLLSPQIRLVIARRDFTDILPRPAIQLPSFALTGTLRDPETALPELRRTFQSVLGFLNIVGAMNGNPQLDQDIVVTDTAKIYTSSFIPDADERESTQARIHFNFAPSLAFSGDRFALSSTPQLAQDILSSASEAPVQQPRDKALVNTAMKISPAVLRELVDDNRNHLIAQNMIKEGHTREEAEKEIEKLVMALTWLGDVWLELKTEQSSLALEFGFDTPRHNR